jgi:DNA-binding transcriptional regulator PaaX
MRPLTNFGDAKTKISKCWDLNEILVQVRGLLLQFTQNTMSQELSSQCCPRTFEPCDATSNCISRMPQRK